MAIPSLAATGKTNLKAAIANIGGKPVLNHPSSFWFADARALLTVYVDDLLLAGPEGCHADIWHALTSKAKIDLDPPETLDRFIGRTHRLTAA